MKALFFILIACTSQYGLSQSCQEQIAYLEENHYGSTYSSPLSDAVVEVTFYDVTVDYDELHFAVVCFKREYSYGCSEYLYQVGWDTETNYSMRYLDSAGKAFWKYIKPYSDNSPCAPEWRDL